MMTQSLRKREEEEERTNFAERKTPHPGSDVSEVSENTTSG